MSKKDKFTDLYLYIKELNAKGKYKEVVKYANKYLEMQGTTGIQGNKVQFMKAKALRQLERFDEAIEILKSGIAENNFYYIFELFFLYYHLNKYEEALKLLPFLYNYKDKTFKNYSLSIMELVMKKSLGLEILPNEVSLNDNIKMQIIDYNEEKSIETIKLHTIENIDDFESESYFNENVDIDYLIDCLKEFLKVSKKANINESLEVHYFLVPKIGIYDSNICNYIKVILIPNTNNIIATYPTSYTGVKEVPILNCDYDRLFSKNQKQYRIN